MRWEYRFVGLSIEAEKAIEELNKLGQEGWEAIQFEWHDNVVGIVVVLKRLLTDSK